MTRILMDLHHHALAESVLMLFEDRELLGPDTQVFFPTGMQWFDEGYWNFERAWHGDAVARQYLLGWWDGSKVYDGVAYRDDPRYPDRVQKGITLDAARDAKWDFVISSLPHNDEGLYRLSQETGARFGVQVGNNLQSSRWDLAEFILASSTLPDEGLVDPSTWSKVTTYRGKPAVIYHQEYSLDYFGWKGTEEAARNVVASFVNCFPEGPSYPQFVDFARAYRDEFDFRVYGAYGRGGQYHDEFEAGDVSFVPDVAAAQRGAGIAWHSKHWSDGYGHTVHSWFSIGRPVVGIQRYYADKLAGPLFEEGVTSFDIESRSWEELATLMRRLRDDADYHAQISANAAQRFSELVDFDADAAAVRELMS